MCQIFLLQPGQMPDKDDFATSALNNPHGWGLAHTEGDGSIDYAWAKFPDDVKEELDVKEQVDASWSALEDFKDRPRLFHQRYTTVGEMSIGNAHPFPILDRDTQNDYLSLCLVHNGTLSKFRKPVDGAPLIDDQGIEVGVPSDTRNFALGLVSPMAQVLDLMNGMSVDDGSIKESEMQPFWEEPWVKHVLASNVDTTSRVAFLDGLGRHYIVNEDTGTWLDSGIWVANTYSFNSSHRTPKTPAYYQGGAGYYNGGKGTASKVTPSTPVKKEEKVGNVPAAGGTAPNSAQYPALVKDTPPTVRQLFDPTLVPQKFTTVAKINEVDLLYLNKNALEDMQEFYPEHTILLTMELQAIVARQCKEMEALKKRNDTQKKTIEGTQQGAARYSAEVDEDLKKMGAGKL